ncbi:adenine deaminase C-terminal domain-containing protein [Bacillus carboniphilus]|uniref:adenine deaminase n=1 Tax=Bacillus carboniphilus TaxID=86663 RepID=A0ABY9JS67_9BACI|nr:adenine deaminase C-terminal domain-containing protein [Bacillus carboniphilus]WLR42250.1 adenine deaminase C-terminal domain-containing protein [Bacillus carboniphilus]
MPKRFHWKTKQMKEQIDILSNPDQLTICLLNATILQPYLNRWIQANVWIYKDRIIYIGDELPKNYDHIEVVDCQGKYIVPGYIEPHAHPFQLYNPHSLAEYVSKTGTTFFFCDNLFFLLQYAKKKAFSVVDQLNKTPIGFYWWARYDLQTEVLNEEKIFTPEIFKQWLEHPYTIQGGELTGWPKLLSGDQFMLHQLQETKNVQRRIEGHLPGASFNTLTKMKLAGVDSDHESMTGEDVYKRLLAGYHVSLRHSSIRPDLRNILKEMSEYQIDCYDHLFLTTDGSSPSFYEQGMINQLIKICLEEDVPAIEAYKMSAFNIAKYHGLDHLMGVIGPGRYATLNVLESIDNPTPVSVMAKGKWLVKDGVDQGPLPNFNWSESDALPLSLDWELTKDDLQFSMPIGMNMKNSVIMEPYSITRDHSNEQLSTDHDESFLLLIDKNGEWRINTFLKGFASHIQGFASSYSTTGDIIVIGKSKSDMILAFNQLKRIGGGIVLAEKGEILHEIPLHIEGRASLHPFSIVMEEERKLVQLMQERGYRFRDPIYTLLFLSSTHLPYIRVTQRGIYDVMKKTVLFPSIMR